MLTLLKKINNITYIENAGFHQEGYVNQLFLIFENSNYFCIELKINRFCVLCKENLSNNSYTRTLIPINKEHLSLNTLESLLLIITPENTKEVCNSCNLNISSIEKTYSIIKFPKYLLFIFDFDNYFELMTNRINIIHKLQLSLGSPLNDKYDLLGGICMVSSDHFTCFVSKIENIPKFTEQFNKNKIY